MGKKYVFVLGGLLSSLGKGCLSSSIGNLLERKGLRVSMVKCDPYLNFSSDLLSPREHGETFVLNDGWCADLDLGNYQRFTHSTLSRANSITSGQIYGQVLENEKKGVYLGKTVQAVPHVTDEIKRRILNVGSQDNTDITIIEVGGTVGDLESQVYLEAVRQLKDELNSPNNTDVLVIYLTYIIRMPNGEIKSKPAQHSVSELTEAGIKPDILICRENEMLDNSILNKLTTFCGVSRDRIFTSINVPTVYGLPEILKQQKLDDCITNLLGIVNTPPVEANQLRLKWESVTPKYEKLYNEGRPLKIAIVGKYMDNPDSYKSVQEALFHATFAENIPLSINFVNTATLDESNIEEKLDHVDGILIPGGFGSSGIEGMVLACKWARENQIPYFGICLGMQILVIEYARNVVGLARANSTEIDSETEYPVISLLPEQKDIEYMCETMRLGEVESFLNLTDPKYKDSAVVQAYLKNENNVESIREVHRHRYEVNQDYKDFLTRKNGLILEAIFTPRNSFNLSESAEWPNHKGFGVQFHPEFKSRMFEPHPLFQSFVKNAVKYQNNKDKVKGDLC